MRKRDIHILIVDDDASFGESLSRTISKLGYKATVETSAQSALQIAKIKNIHALFIDCMLPKTNGVELAQELRRLGLDDVPIFLMSGIFKDKAFSQDAIRKTNASLFLSKPFETKDFQAKLEEYLSKVVEVPKLPLHALLAKPMASRRDRIKALEKMDEINGFDLPFVISILIQGESSGHLNIYSTEGDIFGITFCNGILTKVDTANTNTVVEKLLIEKDYISTEDLTAYKNMNNKGDILKNLIEYNFISPHIVNEIKLEQMFFEIEDLINSNKMQINFSPAEVKCEDVYISRNLLTVAFAQGLEKKYKLEWLQCFYEPWLDHKIYMGPAYVDLSQVLQFNAIKRVQNLFQDIKDEKTLRDILDENKYDKKQLYVALHILAIKNFIVFDDQKKKSEKSQTDVDRMSLIYESLKDKNPFEVFEYFGAPAKCPPSEVDRIYKEFVKSNHPDKFNNEDEDKQKVINSLFGVVTSAHHILMDPNKRTKYENEKKQETIKKQLQAENIVAQALKKLQLGHYQAALEMVAEADSLYSHHNHQLYMMWAKIKMQGASVNSDLIKKANEFCRDYPEEERKTAIFLFFQGLVKKSENKIDEASNYFQKSLNVDNRFLDARRELGLLAQSKPKQKESILTKDLGEVLGSFFKKKSK